MHANIHTMGVPGEDRQQEMENLLKKIMMENFPNLVKEIDKTNPGSAESPKQEEPNETHTKIHHN